MRTRPYCLLMVLAASFVATAAFGQADVPLRREVPLPAKPGEIDWLVKVPLPPGRAAAVSDVAGVLAISHKTGTAPHVSLVQLDDRGAPTSAAPATIELPHVKQLAGRSNYPLALAVHPKLPLLYVWQDVAPPVKDAPPDDPKTDGFCHLHVYDISSAVPELIQSLAQGDSFARGNTAGAIAFDREAGRLFVPNLQRRNAKGVVTPSIGYLRVLDNGHVVPEDDEVLAAASEGGGAGVDRKGAVTAAARKAYLEQVRTGKLADRATRAATSASTIFAGFPCGLSYFNVSDSVTIVGGALGPVTWDEANRRAQFNGVTFFPIISIGYQLRLAGHPTLPVVFVSGLLSNWVYRMEHVDGFMTLLPQRGTLAGVTALTSSPVVLGKRPYFACGSAKTLHLIGYDDRGALNGERIDVPIASDTVEALAYSPRFDRLYTTVADAKP